MSKLYLYTTLTCHLCEQAEALLKQIQLPENCQIEKRDILNNEIWLEKYRTSIPVLEFKGKELNWPFNKNQLVQFLEEG